MRRRAALAAWVRPAGVRAAGVLVAGVLVAGALVAGALVAGALAACDTTATLYFQLAFPPGQTRLPEATARVRLTLDSPREVREAPVAADGSFTLALEIGARGGAGRIAFEALDAAGTVLAVGRSAPLPINGYEDQFTLYVSPPDAFAAAPVSFDEPIDALAVAVLPYGVLFAGGASAAGTGTRDVRIYNVYGHTLQVGEDLPAGRVKQTVFAADGGLVFLFGGSNALSGALTEGELWVFDTNVAPAGAYRELPGDPALAHAGGQAARLGDGRYVVAAPQLPIIDPVTGAVTRSTTDSAIGLGATTATALLDGRVLVAGGAAAFLVDADGGGFAPVLPGRSSHAAVRLPDGRVLLVGGTADGLATREAIGLRADGTPFVVPDLLAETRGNPAAAVAGDRLVVAGGDGSGLVDPRTTAEIFDATTLESLGTVPLVAARSGASAITLANDSVLLVGGGAATIELYQPGARETP